MLNYEAFSIHDPKIPRDNSTYFVPSKTFFENFIKGRPTSKPMTRTSTVSKIYTITTITLSKIYINMM